MTSAVHVPGPGCYSRSTRNVRVSCSAGARTARDRCRPFFRREGWNLPPTIVARGARSPLKWNWRRAAGGVIVYRRGPACGKTSPSRVYGTSPTDQAAASGGFSGHSIRARPVHIFRPTANVVEFRDASHRATLSAQDAEPVTVSEQLCKPQDACVPCVI
jgi:hypothetical protein